MSERNNLPLQGYFNELNELFFALSAFQKSRENFQAKALTRVERPNPLYYLNYSALIIADQFKATLDWYWAESPRIVVLERVWKRSFRESETIYTLYPQALKLVSLVLPSKLVQAWIGVTVNSVYASEHVLYGPDGLKHVDYNTESIGQIHPLSVLNRPEGNVVLKESLITPEMLKDSDF